MTNSNNPFKLVNYSNSLVNLTSSIMKYFSVKTKHSGLTILDQLIAQKVKTPENRWKNIVVLLFDGMGIDALEHHLSKNSFLRKNLLSPISSVFPPTTTAATTSINSGLTPAEHAWLGWTLYFPQIDQNVNVFPNTLKDTKEQAASYNVAKRFIPYKSVFERIGKDKAFNVSKFGTNKVNTMIDMFTEIERLCSTDTEKYIYGYQEFPDNIMHVMGTYSFAVKMNIHRINQSVRAFCKKLKKNEKTKNTLVIVTADHGHLPIENITLSDYPEFSSMLVRPISLEARCTNFFVKDEFKQTFASKFYELFSKDDFILLTKQEAIEKQIFGNLENSKCHPAFENDFLGDFISIAITNKAFVNTQKSNHFKSHHAGLTEKEMLIPFIAIDLSESTKL